MKKLDTEGAFNEIFGDQKTEEAERPQKTIQDEKIVVGLDIGATKVVCIVGKKTKDETIMVLGYGECASEGIKLGSITNMADVIESVRTAVEQASELSGVEIHSVNLGITCRHLRNLRYRGVLMRDNHETEITEAELERLRNDTFKINMTPGEEIIDVIRQDTYVDGELAINPVGMLGSKIEANFHVIIGQTSAAKNILKCIENVGLEVERVVLSSVASSKAVLTKEEINEGVVLLDIGGDTTDLAVFKKNKIQLVAVIPFGGNIITEDICTGCHTLKRYAEEVKVKFGSALAGENRDDEVIVIPGNPPKEISFKSLAHIIQARLEEIFELVNFEIQKAKSENQLIAGIVLTGGGAMMRHIQQLAEFMTGLDVRIGYPNEQIVLTVNDLASPKYATCIGLVIEGFNRREVDSVKKQGLKKEIYVEGFDKRDNKKKVEEEQSIMNQELDESDLLSSDSKLKGWLKRIVRK